jgi:hypothetical protein
VQDCAAGADNPGAVFIDDVDMNQFLIARRLQQLPRRATVAGYRQDAVDDNVSAAG